DALPVAVELLYHAEDTSDQHIPLLIWWAIEDKAVAAAPQLLDLLRKQEGRGFWKQPLVKSVLLERIGRRYVAAGENGFSIAAELLDMVPSGEDLTLLARGMAKALEGQRLAAIPKPLEAPLLKRWAEQPGSADFLRLAVRLGSEPAYLRVLKTAADGMRPDAERIQAVELLAEGRRAAALPVVLGPV